MDPRLPWNPGLRGPVHGTADLTALVIERASDYHPACLKMGTAARKTKPLGFTNDSEAHAGWMTMNAGSTRFFSP